MFRTDARAIFGNSPFSGRPRMGQYPYPGRPPMMPPPAYAPEIISPEHWQEEKHCYECPDGTRRFLTLIEARALGCSPLPYQACRSGTVMGQNGVNNAGFPWIPIVIGLGLVATAYYVTTLAARR